MRGKLLQGKYALESNRITPAGAGKTATDIGTNMTAQDHPRRCGENGTECAVYSTDEGSPPQVRGKQT